MVDSKAGLQSLFEEEEYHGDSLCEGCGILKLNKPDHSIRDYNDLEQADVLFLSDSLKLQNGKFVPFGKKEFSVIFEALESVVNGDILVEFSASVKCPSVREAEMTPNNSNLCREHLKNTIRKVNPRLIIACGNLALKMLTKKSGITQKRGKIFHYELSDGNETKDIPVFPVFHPFSVVKEPSNKFLFQTDIKNAIEVIILGKRVESEFQFSAIYDIKQLSNYDHLRTTDFTLAVDVETEGLNFLKHRIFTVAISWNNTNKGWDPETVVIPIDHRDSPLSHEDRCTALSFLKDVLENPKSRKVLHNCKFDSKFFKQYEIEIVNIHDTKGMHQLYKEGVPNSLRDLVEIYFSREFYSINADQI